MSHFTIVYPWFCLPWHTTHMIHLRSDHQNIIVFLEILCFPFFFFFLTLENSLLFLSFFHCRPRVQPSLLRPWTIELGFLGEKLISALPVSVHVLESCRLCGMKPTPENYLKGLSPKTGFQGTWRHPASSQRRKITNSPTQMHCLSTVAMSSLAW